MTTKQLRHLTQLKRISYSVRTVSPSFGRGMVALFILIVSLGLYFSPVQLSGVATAAGISRLVFTGEHDGNRNIFVADADGANQAVVVDDAGEDNYAAWGPEQKQIAYIAQHEDRFDLMVVDADGTNKRQVMEDFGKFNSSPTWSPDGKRLAFVSDRVVSLQIYVVDLETGVPVPLTSALPTESNESVDPAWSPDGSTIAFISNREQNSYQLYLMNADGSDVRALTTPDDGTEKSTPAWSPDGSRICFVASGERGAEVRLIQPNGENDVQLVDLSSDDSNSSISKVSWLPDGSELIYAVDIDGSSTLRVIAADGSGSRQLQLDVPASWPDWASPVQVDPIDYTVSGSEVLHVGGKAEVYVEDEGLKLRSGAGTQYRILENMPSGSVVTILDGPRRGGIYTWWYVRSPGNRKGWSVEAADGIQTLIPFS